MEVEYINVFKHILISDFEMKKWKNKEYFLSSKLFCLTYENIFIKMKSCKSWFPSRCLIELKLLTFNIYIFDKKPKLCNNSRNLTEF